MNMGQSYSVEISVVLGAYNRRSFLKAAIESVRGNGITVPYEIIVVDGGSTDGSLRWLSRQKDIITIIQHNRGTYLGKPIPRRSWGYFMNLGFKCTQGKYILMISDDSLVVPGSIMKGYDCAESLLAQGRMIGAVAFYWRNWPDQDQYWVGLTLGDKLMVNHGLYRRDAVESIGWIDEERYKFYHADGDLSLKLWQNGHEVVDCPDAFIEHFTHANLKTRHSNHEWQKADWSAYLDRWTDIYYDPEKQNIGSWNLLAFEDPHHSVLKYPREEVMMYSIKRGIRQFLVKTKRALMKAGSRKRD
jgi:GT2 family glycosyltransferase